MTITRHDAIVAVLLVFVMLLGGYFRFTGLNWDDFVRFHPDERFLTGNTAPSLNRNFLSFTGTEPGEEQYQRCLERYPESSGIGGYFDSQCSDWNPHNVGQGLYVYGTLPLFTARIVAEVVADVNNDAIWTGYDGIFLIWRTISAISDMFVILLVFFIGRQMHNRWVGLLAAALYAFAVFPIQQAHFGTADPMSNLFVTLSILFAVRTQDSGKLFDYGGFGLAFGLALSSRINILPVVGLILVVAVLRILPIFFGNVSPRERDRILMTNFAGLFLAGAITFFVFRLLNPYAFQGPGFFGILPNDRWLQDISEAQHLVSGNADSPPNFQWVNRIDYLFPWQNMVLWGMGIALGLTGWIAWVWSGWRVVFGKTGATRNLLVFGWILVYFGWLGGNWVASMRYFLPLYAPFAVLAAWMIWELIQRTDRPRIRAWRRFAAVGFGAFVLIFTLLWALMYTNVYRHQATFVQASHWVWENVPGDFAMRIDGADDDVPLLNVAFRNTLLDRDHPIETYVLDGASQYVDNVPQTTTFTAYGSGTVSLVHAPHLGELNADEAPETVTITVTQSSEDDNSITVLARATLIDNLSRTDHILGNPYDILFDQPFEVVEGETYNFNVSVSGGPIVTGSIMAYESQWEESMPAKVCQMPDGLTLADDPPSGLNSARDCNGRAPWEGLLNMYSFNTDWEDVDFKRDRMLTILEQTDYIIVPTNRRYDSQSRNPSRWPLTTAFYDALFNEELGFELVTYFQETFEFGPLRVSDQHLPIYDSPDWLNEFEPEEAFTVYDHPVVFIFQKTADYDSQAVTEFLFGVPLTRVNSGYYGIYTDPNIADVVVRDSYTADQAPSLLEYTPDMLELQQDSGTWSDRFDRESWINTSGMIVTVVVWWLVVVLIGLIVYPLLWLLLPGLADRGYGFAKFLGMLLAGWATWYLATLRVPVWSQSGLIGAFAILACISGVIIWRRRADMIAYLRARWRLLVIIEGLSLLLFVLFIFVRLTNPDLWEVTFGGEKPMDFAYFNGVLRSTIFPPIDPWFAGGYINYYYFGYVIVGVPTLITGIVPSVAYNLIVPTLFSITGLAAFSMAYSIVNGWRVTVNEVVADENAPDENILDEVTSEEIAQDESSSIVDGLAQDTDEDNAVVVQPVPASRPRRRTVGNPLIAGIVALILAIGVGNLDTIRVFGNAIAQLGGYEIPQGLQKYIVDDLSDDYFNTYRVQPGDEALGSILEQARFRVEENRLSDRVNYEIDKITSLVSGFGRGVGRMLNGESPNISPNRWFWAPTRVITEIPTVGGGAINEMPYFTFLYGDLHAHMIAMPLILFAALFVFHEILLAGNDPRSWKTRYLTLALGGIAVGMSKAVNTWDYPTLMILAFVGLGYAWWLRWEKITRRSLLDMLLYVGGFGIFSAIAIAPYDMWFATAYTQLLPWEGGKTPIWAYLDIHGLFLFLAVSLLVWETARWLRVVKVRDLRGRGLPLLAGLFVFLVALLIGVIFFLRGERVTLIVVPLLAWIGMLFFRPKQSRVMQFVLVLIGLSLCITLGVEFFVLSGDNGRQNMVFKFYMQVWLLLSVAGGAAFSWIISNSDFWRGRLRGFWFGVAGLLFFLAALYPIMATQGKAAYRMAPDTPVTLDGMEFMRYAQHWEGGLIPGEFVQLINDYNAIRWLQDNVQGSPVIMEAQSLGSLYRWGGRISIHTGLPSVVGWDHHQTQQRSLEPMPGLVRQRAANVNAFYQTQDIYSAAQILRFYNVEYVILTDYERGRYSESGGLDKFDFMVEDGMLEIAYKEGDATIYQVIQEALPQPSLAFSLESGG